MTSAPAALHCTFGPITVAYDERVLTPRPWTLAQSEWAADLAADLAAELADRPPTAKPPTARPPTAKPPTVVRMLELCAGAGHIGLAAAVLAGGAVQMLVQVELDAVAAGYAVSNALAAGWGDRVEVRNAAMHEALASGETFDLILADPPYLPTRAVSRWPGDPVRAIDGGADGLDLVRACLVVAQHHLADKGELLLQVAGPAQGRQVEELLPEPLRVHDLRVTDDERAVVRIVRG